MCYGTSLTVQPNCLKGWGSVWNCLWGQALKRSPGINRESRVSYPGPGFLSSATRPLLPKMHYNGLINQSIDITVCGGIIDSSTQPSGEVVSPGYGQNDTYAHNLNCLWTLTSQAHSNASIALWFTEFNLERHGECRYDYVEITEGMVPNNFSFILLILLLKENPKHGS